MLESNIRHDFVYNNSGSATFKETVTDIKSGVTYINSFIPVRAVFIFFTVVIIANGVATLTYPYFANNDALTIEGYALLTSINSLGYMFGGFFHSFVNIPNKYRYHVALVIYFIFIMFDAVFLFVPYTIMLLMKFILGLAGMNSANIRNTAVQASVADKQRGKVNGVFSMLMGFASIVGNLLFGFLGERISIPYLFIFAQAMYLGVVLLIYINPKNAIKPFYNLELAVDQPNTKTGSN